MGSCEHLEACLDLAQDGTDAWIKRCECGVVGGGGSLQQAWRVFDINVKRKAGEKMTDQEWTILAYTPSSQGGTAASCPSSVVFGRSFLLGST